MRKIALGAALGSAGMLLGALAFQYLGGLPPCKMCIWQRWPHGIAILLGLLIYVLPMRVIALAGAAVVLVGAGIAFYHAGVEQSWFEGPNTCTSNGIGNMSNEDLLAQILATPVVRCDDIAWSLIGLSMAAWNSIISVGLAGLWLFAFRKGASA